MMHKLEKSEKILLILVMGLIALSVFFPLITHTTPLDGFADQRTWWGIPCAMDVLSNVPFALAGLLGLGFMLGGPLHCKSKPQRAQQILAALFFGGLLITSVASSWYHLNPVASGLVLDRLGMTVAFAGVVGLAAAERCSARAGLGLSLLILMLAPVAVGVAFFSSNVVPWAALQFGGMALVLWFASLKPTPGAMHIRWIWVIAIYACAKLLELGDHTVWQWTHGMVSGHSLKHMVAALAAWPVIQAMQQTRTDL